MNPSSTYRSAPIRPLFPGLPVSGSKGTMSMFSAFNGRRRFAGPGGSTSQRGLSRLRAVGAAALVSLCMACAQIPTSGVVQEGVDEVSVPRSGYLIASGPTAGADQLEIVQGFLRA